MQTNDHCLCLNKTLFMEISTEADLPVGCSLSDAAFGAVESKVACHAIPDLVLSDAGDRLSGLPLLGHRH